MIKERRTPMRRRLRSASVVIISQMLLIAMAIAWLFHMISIAIYGAVYFIERNQFILWAEIVICVLITGFAIYVLALQIQRLGERRQGDRRME